ncbi:MAG: F0F1 ATP synthase subunit B [Firmicutes bacterium]|jgi:F-type H+-transporting ATPase subunit b|nr:F0F1 ATP synthase subunit B [Bacillota bacterium]
MEGGLISPNLISFLYTIINFGVVLLALRLFLFKPLMRHMKKRRDSIQEALDQAEQARDELARIRSLAEEERQRAHREAEDIIASAVREAEKVKREIILQAREESKRIIAATQEEVKHEKERALEDLKENMVNLAILAASKVTELSLDEKTGRKLVTDFLDNLDLRDVSGGVGA